jgi:hypothetical protein
VIVAIFRRRLKPRKTLDPASSDSMLAALRAG